MAGKNTIGPKIVLDGEAQFRESIKNIENTMKTLNSEMKVVKSQFDKNDESTEALTAKNEVLNKIIEEQKKKLAELEKGLKSAAESYGENDERTQKWQRELNEATAKLNNLERELRQNTEKINENEKAAESLGNEIKDLGTDFKTAGEKALSFGDIVKANLVSTAIVGGIKTLASGIKSIATNAIEAADKWQTLADIYGTTAERIQELNYAGTKLDVSLETILDAQTKLSRSMYEAKDGTSEQARAFDALGVSVTDANGNLRNAQDVMTEALEALKKYGNETERDALTMKIFGKSAMDLNPLIKAGGDELNRLSTEARQTGAIVSNDAVKAFDDFGDTMDGLKIKMQASLAKSITPLIPKLQDLADKVADFDFTPIINGLGWVIDNAKPIISGIAGITAGIAAFKATTAIITIQKSAMDALTASTTAAKTAQDALNVSQKASPAGWIAALAGLVVTGLTAYALSAKSASDETSKLSEEIEESSRTIESNIKSRKSNIESIEIEHDALEGLTNKLFDLSDKSEKTNADKAQMASIAERLNKAIPELNISIDKETGLLSKQREEVLKLIAANETYYKVKAAQNNLTTIQSDIQRAQNIKEQLEKERDDIKSSIESTKKLIENTDTWEFITPKWNEILNKRNLENELEGLYDKYNDISSRLKESEKNLQSLNNEWDKASKYVHENIDALNLFGDKINNVSSRTNKALSDVTNAIQDQLSKRKSAVEESHNNAIEKIREEYGVFEQKEKNKTEVLQDSLSKKKTIFDSLLSYAKSAAEQEKEAFAESSKKILEEAQKLHNQKIDMYAQEYLAQIGAIDKKTAEYINSYKAEIAAIEEAREKESEALKQKQNEERINSIQEKIKKVRTKAERLQLEKELQEEIEKQNREALEKQRQDRIKSLNQQIADATEKAKKEKNELLKTFTERIAEEQKAIESDTQYKIAKIQEERLAKEKAETAKYEAVKRTLDKSEKALDEYLEKYKDKLSQAAVENLAAVKTLGELLKGTGITLPSITDTGDLHMHLNESGICAMQGFIDGIKSKIRETKQTLSDILKGIVRQGNVILEIKSPSKVFKRMGEYSALGYEAGWVTKMESVRKSVSASLRALETSAAPISNLSLVFGDLQTYKNKSALSPIDYNLMTNAFITALRKLNLVVKVDRDKIGAIAVDYLTRGVDGAL